MSKATSILSLLEQAGSETVTMFHGGRLDGGAGDISHSSGRWKYGPGLYLTTDYDVAAQYAKGSRKLYLVTVKKGTDISEVTMPLDDVKEFLRIHGKNSKKIYDSLVSSAERLHTTPKVGASAFLNTIINSKGVTSTNSGELKNFLVSQGVDYAIDRFKGYPMLVVMNNRKIVKTEAVDRSKLKEFTLPFDWK